MFAPFWILYFVIGCVTAFLYDAYRPAEKINARIWGYVADVCTLLILGLSMLLICQGDLDNTEEYYFRPAEGNQHVDNAQTSRLWDNINGRILVPISTVYVFALSTGEGLTAYFLSSQFLADGLAPHPYNCFLFHQFVGQWYFAATRNGLWWSWWRYRKRMYWFSPRPCPVEWYEYFFIVMLSVSFSALMNKTAMPLMAYLMDVGSELFCGKSDEKIFGIEAAIISSVEDMTGISPELDWTLDQCGLSSIGLPQLAMRLQKSVSTKSNAVSVSAASLSSARTIGDVAIILSSIKKLSNTDGIK